MRPKSCVTLNPFNMVILFFLLYTGKCFPLLLSLTLVFILTSILPLPFHFSVLVRTTSDLAALKSRRLRQQVLQPAPQCGCAQAFIYILKHMLLYYTWSSFNFSVMLKEWFTTGDIWRFLETCLVVTSGSKVWLASRGLSAAPCPTGPRAARVTWCHVHRSEVRILLELGYYSNFLKKI